MKINRTQRQQLKDLASQAQQWAKMADPFQEQTKIDALINLSKKTALEALENDLSKILDKDEKEFQRLCSQKQLLSSFNFSKKLEQVLSRRITGFDKWRNETKKILLELGQEEKAKSLDITPLKPNINNAGDYDYNELSLLIRKNSKTHYEEWERYLLLAQHVLKSIAENSLNNVYLLKHAKKTLLAAMIFLLLGGIVSIVKSYTSEINSDENQEIDVIK